MLKVENKDTETTSFEIVLVSITLETLSINLLFFSVYFEHNFRYGVVEQYGVVEFSQLNNIVSARKPSVKVDDF